MNKLITQNTTLTMTSREIADLTGKRHDNVMRDIRNMIEDLEMSDVLKTEFAEEINNLGFSVKIPLYRLDRDLTDCLLTGYSAIARMSVIKRWKELEVKQVQALPNFNNPVEAARAWADELEAKELLQLQAKESEPKVEAFDAFIDKNRSMTLRDASKAIGMNRQKDFINLLRENGYLLIHANKPSQKALKAGFMVSKHSEHGDQCRITPKGLVYFTKVLHKRYTHLLVKCLQKEILEGKEPIVSDDF